jgi:hypothetical protein
VNRFALAIALLAAAPGSMRADDKPTAAPADACLMLNNRILGPRAQGRPLPLLRGDAEHGFTPACSAAWSLISPKNEPVPVSACYQGSLLQVANDSACGAGTGKLWISARWVVTSADLAQGNQRAAVCQQLETGAWAGTRAFSFECTPRGKELKTDDQPAAPAAAPAAPSSPPAATPH